MKATARSQGGGAPLWYSSGPLAHCRLECDDYSRLLQMTRTGQTSQRFTRAVQTSAPSSINA